MLDSSKDEITTNLNRVGPPTRFFVNIAAEAGSEIVSNFVVM